MCDVSIGSRCLRAQRKIADKRNEGMKVEQFTADFFDVIFVLLIVRKFPLVNIFVRK